MSFTKFIMITMVFVALAVSVSTYVTKAVISPQEAAPTKGIFVKLGDPKEGIITNIGYHYVKIGLVMQVNEDDYPKVEGKAINLVDTKATDTVISTLRSHPPEWYGSKNHNQIREEIKKNLNEVLGKKMVMEVYITNFIMQ